MDQLLLNITTDPFVKQLAVDLETDVDSLNKETQKAFVEEILFIAGYVPDQIQVYQRAIYLLIFGNSMVLYLRFHQTVSPL